MGKNNNKPLVSISLTPTVEWTGEIDHINIGEINKIRGFKDIPIGNGMNIAKVIKDLNIEVIASGILSINSKSHLYFLDKYKIINGFINNYGYARVRLLLKDKDNKITEFDFQSDTTTLKDFNKLLTFLKSVESEMFIISGGIPSNLSKDAFKIMIWSLKNLKKTIALKGDGEEFDLGIQALPNIVQENLNNLRKKFDTELSKEKIISIGQSYINKGIEFVIIYLSNKEVLFFSDNEMYEISYKNIVISNIRGLEDALFAGFCCGYYWKFNFLESIKLAANAFISTVLSEEIGFKKIKSNELLSYLVIKKYESFVY